MSWECPDCSYKNDDELIRCVCGYEIGESDGRLLADIDYEKQEKTYAEKWKEYRKLRKTVYFILLTYIPAGVLCALINHYLFPFGAITFIVIVTWLIAFAVTVAGLRTWPCPRCDKWFHAKKFWHNEFSGKCLHCGLPKWAEQDVRDADNLKYDEIRCLKCGHVISNEDSLCLNCGWSWEDNSAQPGA
jgi:hypothetical protein